MRNFLRHWRERLLISGNVRRPSLLEYALYATSAHVNLTKVTLWQLTDPGAFFLTFDSRCGTLSCLYTGLPGIREERTRYRSHDEPRHYANSRKIGPQRIKSLGGSPRRTSQVSSVSSQESAVFIISWFLFRSFVSVIALFDGTEPWFFGSHTVKPNFPLVTNFSCIGCKLHERIAREARLSLG